MDRNRVPAWAGIRTWRTDWTQLTTFFDYPPEIRKVIYTTNAIESLNPSLRKIIKTRGAFPDDEAVMKLLYLALQNVARRWTMPFLVYGHFDSLLVGGSLLPNDRLHKLIYTPPMYLKHLLCQINGNSHKLHLDSSYR